VSDVLRIALLGRYIHRQHCRPVRDRFPVWSSFTRRMRLNVSACPNVGEEYRLVKCRTTHSGTTSPTFRRNILLGASDSKNQAKPPCFCCFLGVFIHSKDVDSAFLRNVDKFHRTKSRSIAKYTPHRYRCEDRKHRISCFLCMCMCVCLLGGGVESESSN
jgi:hypothetical protein